MSHYTVLVIGNDPEKQLQPYHEYECTGIEDEYVIDVDYTDKIKDYLERKLFVGKKKDSEDYDYEYDEETAKENLVSYEEMTKLQYLELIKADIDKEVAEEFGVEKKDGIWYRKTNPNSKWDWYQLGGRWAGFFKLKEGAVGEVGGSLFGPPAENGYVDQAKKGDIDFEGMRNEAAKEASEAYDKAMTYIGHISDHENWDVFRDRIFAEGGDIDEARKKYHDQPKVKAWNQIEDRDFKFRYDVDRFSVSKEEFVDRARNSACVSFAVVKDSKWYEKGKMGWWAMVSNEKDPNEWNREFNKLIDSVSDDALISLYDCHI